MAISIQCPSCQKQLKGKDELAGKRVKCPACGAGVTLPMALPREDVVPFDTHSARIANVKKNGGMSRPEELPSRLAVPPRHAKEQPSSRSGLEGVAPNYRICLSHWFAVARPHYRAVLGPSVGYFFLVLPILAVCIFVSTLPLSILVDSGFRGATRVLIALVAWPICLLPMLVVFPALAIGFHAVAQAELKGKPWTFGTFFSGFRWTWQLAGRAVVLVLVEIATVLPPVAIEALAGRAPPFVVVGLVVALQLAFLLAGGYVLLRLVFFSHFLMMDRGCGLADALRGSWCLSRGHFWGLLGTMLLVLAMVGVIPLLVLGIHLLWTMPMVLLILLLALALVVLLLALPAGVLFLNAGYLLVAGARPLPSHERESEWAEPRPSSVLQWLPAGLVSLTVLLVGAGMALNAENERTRLEKQMVQRREVASRNAEKARLEEIRAREEAEEQAKHLVSFFREGGYWSMEIYADLDERDARPSDGPAGPSGGPASRGPGGTDGTSSQHRRVLVLGPRDMLKKKQTVPLLTSVEPAPGWEKARQQLEELPYASSSLGRQAFYRAFADAMALGELEAVTVEVALQTDSSVGGSGTFDGRGSAGLPGSPGGAAIGAESVSSRGAPVPLDKAVPIKRERFLALVR